MMIVVFSDLDGTLLDHHTYRLDGAREGLDLLRERRIPLVPVSSKTLAEMSVLAEELNIDGPFIFENGGGIRWPGAAGTEDRGPGADELRKGAPLLERVLGSPVRFIIDMDPEEVAGITGLTLERARLAQRRSSSLPFLFPDGATPGAEAIEHADRELGPSGYRITRGGRFYHFLPDGVDKGRAVAIVTERYRRDGDDVVTAAIGDSENDMPMLTAVDMPFIVRRPDGSAIANRGGAFRITDGIGPRGFTEAVRIIVNETTGGRMRT